MDTTVLTGHAWRPLQTIGLTSSFWNIQFDTFISTVIITGIIICLSLFINANLKNPKNIVRYIATQYLKAFKDLLEQTLQCCPSEHLYFIASLFSFILCCNTISILPWLEEPTKDLNTTLALGVISFCYVQGTSIRVNGLKSYIADFFEPFFVMFPLNVVGTFTSIISLSFRLFGNIFGGFIISSLYSKMLAGSILLETLGLVTGANIAMTLLFGVFEGLIQAFVFSMLTLTYLSLEIVDEEEEEELA